MRSPPYSPSHSDDDGRFHEPFFLRYGSRHRVDPARVIRRAGQIATEDGSDQSQRENDEEANTRDGDHRTERDRPRSVVVNSDEVDEKRGSTNRCRQQEGGQNHLQES